MFPTLFQFGSLRIATYGLFVAAGYLAGIQYLASKRERMGLGEDSFWRLIYWLFLGAVLGGKLLYWAVEWRSIIDGTLRPLADFRYGFVFYGGLLGASAVGFWVARSLKKSCVLIADYLSVAVPLGQGIGRLGCFAAGCCSGLPSNMPWAVRFTHEDSLVPQMFLGVPLHPVQLYEAAGDFLIAGLLTQAVSRVEGGRLKKGSAALAYVALYAFLRFCVEFFRGDDRGAAWGLSVSQWIALACLASAGIIFLRSREARP
ncbi:MAG: prolipoprotein diacylglyceryl transferase [Elusimicrobiota bacterium]|jgi:phosphatidylglycerol:prolipoprotein diacylglycerol transferase